MYAICEFMPYEIHITGNTLLQIVLCGYPILYKKRNVTRAKIGCHFF